MKKLIFRGPVLTASGYGEHARQLLMSLVDGPGSGLFDVSVQSTTWGQTPFIHSGSVVDRIVSLVKKGDVESRLGTKYDLSVQVTIPNEFQRLASVNVGVTAGIEVDRSTIEWITKTNENVDFVVVPSRHSFDTFANVQYRSGTGHVVKLNKPIMIIPEGVDTSVFNTGRLTDELAKMFSFDTSFNFICVGLGLDRGMGEDRKNISTLVKLFCEKFKDDHDVGLVLKVGIVGTSLLDRNIVCRRIADIKSSVGCGEFPRVHVVHGRLSDVELAALYKNERVKAFITLTHGEGFGLPLLEAAACGLPVIATDWSGHVDFLKIDSKRKFVPLDYELRDVPASAVWSGVIDKGSRWAYVKEQDVVEKMLRVVASYDKPKEWASELASHVSSVFSTAATGAAFASFMQAVSNMTEYQTAKNAFEYTDKLKKRFDDISGGRKALLYTMPASAGDVYMSTAVVCQLRKKFPDHFIFFATSQKYFSILRENKNIDLVIQYEQWMTNVSLCSMMFDEVFTPNLAIQLVTSNWVKNGRGRKLAEEIAAQCDVELGEYEIALRAPELSSELPDGRFIILNTGPGVGQWGSRNYRHWEEVVTNLKKFSSLPVVQVGLTDEPLVRGTIDFRGKTSDYNEIAWVISRSALVVSIDTCTMHMAAGMGIPHVAIFGSSYVSNTSPAKSKSRGTYLESKTRWGCRKCCWNEYCRADPDYPCVNEIAANDIVAASLELLEHVDAEVKPCYPEMYERIRPKISGYTHVFNAERNGYPFVESIRSMLGFCDEVIVVDGGSEDSTVEMVMSIGDPRVKLHVNKWDWSEPAMDGVQKSLGRSLCSCDVLWQQDADEVVHEDDYDKIRKLVLSFPNNYDIVDLPIIELWGSCDDVRTDIHSWKWRLSRNKREITHGINAAARVVDERTGKTFARKGMSDGCEYIDSRTHEYYPHRCFYMKEHEVMRLTNHDEYGRAMNDIFERMPCVFHYSWADIARKIRNFRDFWDGCWSNLYNLVKKEQRFFAGRDIETVTDEELLAEAAAVRSRGGEHAQSKTFKLKRSNPKVMDEWLKRLGR